MATDAQARAAAAPAHEDDYETLLALLTASARGRAFLAEFARRNRQADTDLILAALRRLEERILARPRLALVPTSAPPDAPDAPSPQAASPRREAPARASIPEVDWTVDAAAPRRGEARQSSAAPGEAGLAALMALGEEERLALFS